jgi:hypothetical protein
MTSTPPRNPPSSFKPVVLTDASGVAFLQRHPATRVVATQPSTAGLVQAAMHFRDDVIMPPQEEWAMPNANVPGDLEPDLSFENAGDPPPLGFWMTHPDVLAWTTSSIDGSGDEWWVKVWLKGS